MYVYHINNLSLFFGEKIAENAFDDLPHASF